MPESFVVHKNDLFVGPDGFRNEVVSKLHLSHPGVNGTILIARNDKSKDRLRSLFWFVLTPRQSTSGSGHAPTDFGKSWPQIFLSAMTKCTAWWLIITVVFPKLTSFIPKRRSNGIRCLRAQFSRHDILETLFSDNEPQFTIAEFRQFSSQWKFEHHIGTPYQIHSNVKAESAVKAEDKRLSR